MTQKSVVFSTPEDEFISIVKSSKSYSECCRKLGISSRGRQSPNLIKTRCRELGINERAFFSAHNTACNVKYSLDEILVENSKYKSTNKLKARLIKEGRMENKCSMCGNRGVQNGKPLVLEMHHINGICNDNRIENLALLCPNCHSQTDTYCGKNKKTSC